MLIGEPQTPHFYDFGILERVPGAQNQLFLSFETPGYLNKFKKNPWNILRDTFLSIPLFWKPNMLTIFREGGHRQMMKIR